MQPASEQWVYAVRTMGIGYSWAYVVFQCSIEITDYIDIANNFSKHIYK